MQLDRRLEKWEYDSTQERIQYNQNTKARCREQYPQCQMNTICLNAVSRFIIVVGHFTIIVFHLWHFCCCSLAFLSWLTTAALSCVCVCAFLDVYRNGWFLFPFYFLILLLFRLFFSRHVWFIIHSRSTFNKNVISTKLGVLFVVCLFRS